MSSKLRRSQAFAPLVVSVALASACQSRTQGNEALNTGSRNEYGCLRMPFDALLGIACLKHSESDWAITPAKVSNPSLPILLMPGHGDYQTRALKSGESWDTWRACAGSNGTNGEARDKNHNPTAAQNLSPSPCPDESGWELSDEACWNIALVRKVEKLAPSDLKLTVYDSGRAARPLHTFTAGFPPPHFESKKPPASPTRLPTRCIEEADDPHSQWAQGYAHMKKGGYAFEVHFDAWNHEGQGAGVIVANPQAKGALVRQEDVALAQSFGAYPSDFKRVLGAQKRGLSFLEIGQLKGTLEAKLRDPSTREQTLETLARRILDALKRAQKSSL